MKYLVANWKSHKSEEEALIWCEQFAASYQPQAGVEVVLAAPSLYLVSLHNYIQKRALPLKLASQDLSPFPRGGYTGALAADMLAPYVGFSLVGHSERRRYFAESMVQIAQKVEEAQAASIVPIICCSENEIEQQLTAIDDFHATFLAYTPLTAHNSGAVDSLQEITAAITRMRRFSSQVPILYGGALFPNNARAIWSIQGLSGLFVGRSSLNAEEFVELAHRCQAVV